MICVGTRIIAPPPPCLDASSESLHRLPCHLVHMLRDKVFGRFSFFQASRDVVVTPEHVALNIVFLLQKEEESDVDLVGTNISSLFRAVLHVASSRRVPCPNDFARSVCQAAATFVVEEGRVVPPVDVEEEKNENMTDGENDQRIYSSLVLPLVRRAWGRERVQE